MEIGEGQEPIYARVWMMVSQYNALPSAFRNGTGKIGIIMRGQGNDYPATAGMQSIAAQELQFSNAFYLVGARIARAGTTEDLYELKLATIQHWWKFFRVAGGSGGHPSL